VTLVRPASATFPFSSQERFFMSASSMSAATPTRAGGQRRRAPRTGLAWLVASGLLWGTGGLTGRLLIALGTGPTAVAYTLYFRGLRTAAASTGALLSLLEPLTGTILAAPGGPGGRPRSPAGVTWPVICDNGGRVPEY
jgi:hypothetical protein